MTESRRPFLQAAWVFLKRTWRWVVVPHPGVSDFGERRRAQLLMSLALLLAVMCSAGTYFSVRASHGFKPSNINLLLLAMVSWGTYLFGRTRFFRWGAVFLTVCVSVAGYSIVMAGSDDVPGALFSTIPLALILGSVLLPVRAQAALTGFNVLAIVLVGQIHPNLPEAPSYAAVIFTIGALLIVFTIFRDSLERQRLTELRYLNDELLDIQATLEQRVDERTRAAQAALAQAETARQELEAQAWFVRGQLELETAMRGELTLPELADRIIRQVCLALHAHSGILYIRYGNYFQPTGTFVAGPALEGRLPGFEIGEGLVGQAARSQERLLIKNTSPGRLAVITCLGELVPRQVLVFPFIHDRQTSAVIELGALAEFHPQHVEYLERVAPGIAVAIHMAHTRAQVAILRAESDRLDWEDRSGE